MPTTTPQGRLAVDVSETLAFWRKVAAGAAPDHPSHVVVRVLEGILRRAGDPR